jgi:transcriptional regulator with XRE-family HTH domain
VGATHRWSLPLRRALSEKRLRNNRFAAEALRPLRPQERKRFHVLKRPARPKPRRRSEANAFAIALRRLRDEMSWSQDALGARLGVSRRTLTSWECGYWLPPHKQRVQIVLSLKEAPPGHVLDLADGLGVSSDPAAAFLLEEFRQALNEDEAEPSPDPPAPARPRPSPEQLRAATDAVVREAADVLDARPNDLRALVVRVLAVCGELGATLEEARAAATVRPAAKKDEQVESRRR